MDNLVAVQVVRAPRRAMYHGRGRGAVYDINYFTTLSE